MKLWRNQHMLRFPSFLVETLSAIRAPASASAYRGIVPETAAFSRHRFRVCCVDRPGQFQQCRLGFLLTEEKALISHSRAALPPLPLLARDPCDPGRTCFFNDLERPRRRAINTLPYWHESTGEEWAESVGLRSAALVGAVPVNNCSLECRDKVQAYEVELDSKKYQVDGRTAGRTPTDTFKSWSRLMTASFRDPSYR